MQQPGVPIGPNDYAKTQNSDLRLSPNMASNAENAAIELQPQLGEEDQIQYQDREVMTE